MDDQPSPDIDGTPTLAQVAARAGVSPITVSRVVRLPALVAAPTRLRVEAAMRALGYVPNLVAGSLASARTSAVGVLVPTVANAIFADTIQGISDALEPLGYAVFLAQSRYDDMREEKMLAALLGRRPEALIMVGSPATAAGAQMLVHIGAVDRDDEGHAQVGGQPLGERAVGQRLVGVHQVVAAACQ